MSLYTNGVPALATYLGSEKFALDTNYVNGTQPQQVELTLAKLALIISQLSNGLSKTMVAGSIYYSQFNVGATLANPPSSAGTQSLENNLLITGVNVSVGGTGGTDSWYVALYNSAGVLLASSAAFTTQTANTILQIPFSATVLINSGVFYIGLQSNATTATFKSINSPIWPFVTGSQTGVAGTLAAITPPTTYTANLGPQATLY